MLIVLYTITADMVQIQGQCFHDGVVCAVRRKFHPMKVVRVFMTKKEPGKKCKVCLLWFQKFVGEYTLSGAGSGPNCNGSLSIILLTAH